MYKVIKAFHDMQDNNYFYDTGKTYPRSGLNVLPSRIKELSSKENRMGEPLIEEIKEKSIVEEKPKKSTKKSGK